jgi:hypothetical protein
VLDDPEETGLRHVDAHRVVEVFATQRRRSHGPGAFRGRKGGNCGERRREGG